MMCVPFFHVGGSLGMLGSLYSGNTSVVQKRFDAGEWLRLVSEHRVTATFLVPTMLQRILDHPDFATTDLTSLVAIAYGAAAAPIALVRRAMAALPHVAFANVFGQTETLGAYTTLMPDDHRDPARAGSVGRPLPGVEVRVVDPATGDDVEPGTVGELWVNTAQNVTDGWLHTGDLAPPRFRRLHLPERPAERHHQPRGREVRADRGRGSTAFPSGGQLTSRSPGSPTRNSASGWGPQWWLSAPMTLEELRSHCRDLIAYFKLPERLAIVDQIPYSATGKVSRHQIAALIAHDA